MAPWYASLPTRLALINERVMKTRISEAMRARGFRGEGLHVALRRPEE